MIKVPRSSVVTSSMDTFYWIGGASLASRYCPLPETTVRVTGTVNGLLSATPENTMFF